MTTTLPLTQEMRTYLGQRWLDMPLLYDVISLFRERFALTTGEAAEVIAQWIRETQ